MDTGKNNTATIREVAVEAQVSLSTVSRALRDDPRISAETVQKVKTAAEKVGYRRNPYISILMSHLRTSRPLPFQGTLAFIDFFSEPKKWTEWPVHRKWFSGAETRAREMGYGLERFWARQPGMTPTRLTKILSTRGIAGLIIPPDDEHPGQWTSQSLLDFSKFAAVLIGLQQHDPGLTFCCNDQYATSRLACHALVQRGYRRIGFVAPRYIEEIVEFRFGAGYLGATLLEHSDMIPIPVLHSENQAEFVQWYRQHQPDCILALHPQVYTWMRNLKLRLPHEIGFAILDWDESEARFSGIRQNNELVGAAAVDVLIGQIHRNERGLDEKERGILIEGTWVDGKTTRRIPTRSARLNN